MEYLPTIITTLIGAIITSIVSYVAKKINEAEKKTKEEQKKATEEIKALEHGVQILLRGRLYAIYRRCKKQGCATFYDEQEFQSCYEAYKSLGGNGAMNTIKQKFSEFQIDDEEESK